jgi:epoxyqueuosine reductase
VAKRAANPVLFDRPGPSIAGDALTAWIVSKLTASTSDAPGQMGLGFDMAGVCPAEPVAHQQVVIDWLAAGKYGEMAYLREQLAPRLSPELELAGVRSVIMVAQVYQPIGKQAVSKETEPTGRVARYAMQRDYHQSIKRRLHRLADALRVAKPAAEFRTFVDTAPVLERQYASACGLGWHGKNTMIIHPHKGSYFVLGGMYTTLELVPSADVAELAQTNMQGSDHCGSCTRCIDACPTGAITPREVDARVCISALTIERRSVIEPELARKMGTWVFGCDVCQELCPFNGESSGRHGQVPSRLGGFDLLAMLGWKESDRSRLGVSAMKRASVLMLRRNAVIALVNHPKFAEREDWQRRVLEIAGDETEDAMVREQAAWMMRGLGARH